MALGPVPWDGWLAFVGMVLVLMATPGPSQVLMLSTSLSHGFPRALATAAGDLSANVLQMLAAGLGLAGVLAAAPGALAAVTWLGAAWLLWLAWRQWRAAGRRPAARGAAAVVPASDLGGLYARGFVTSATNPKAVVFFAALFPLFLIDGASVAGQLAVLGATYLVLDAAFLAAYGATARMIVRHRVPGRAAGFERAAALMLGLAAILLALGA
jgi:threonine/homoserine/homoserine lactone efflux protein